MSVFHPISSFRVGREIKQSRHGDILSIFTLSFFLFLIKKKKKKLIAEYIGAEQKTCLKPGMS